MEVGLVKLRNKSCEVKVVPNGNLKGMLTNKRGKQPRRKVSFSLDYWKFLSGYTIKSAT